MKNIISQITMKELEQITYRALQESFSEVMAQMLVEMDQAIAEGRDKKGFELKDKRNLTFDSIFGHNRCILSSSRKCHGKTAWISSD